MNFGTIELDDDQKRFQAEVSEILDEVVTPAVHEQLRVTGQLFVDSMLRALGAKRLIEPGWPVEDGGRNLDRLSRYIYNVELHKRGITHVGSDMIWSAVGKFGDPELVAELIPRVAAGEVRFCLGYTEPDGGSDIAAAKVRAVRDGDEWVINGSKIFTTSAEHSEYVFLLTRTDPELPKHRGLTMFLVPLDAPGVEVQGIYTFGGERTNITYYSDVRISDRYRLGAVNDGWTVLRGPLDEEHAFAQKSDGLSETSGRAFMRRAPTFAAFDAAVEWARTSVRPDGTHPIEDPSVRTRLGRAAADIEWASCTEGPLGRVAAGVVNVSNGAALVDLVGPEALISFGEDGAVGNGDVDFAHRFAQGTVTYGGSVEVFRGIIAQHVLGLPRPQLPGSKNLATTRREPGQA